MAADLLKLSDQVELYTTTNGGSTGWACVTACQPVVVQLEHRWIVHRGTAGAYRESYRIS